MHIKVDGLVIKATEQHPFYVVDKGWVEAKDLEIGDCLKSADGSVKQIESLEIEDLQNPIKVYNFEVEDWHTYHVSDSDILVHNDCSQGSGKGIIKSEHAEIRASQGRNVNTAINDVQRARPADILMQDDGRWIIRGQNGRIHILEPNGEIVTTMNNVTKSNLQQRINSGRWSRLNFSQEELFKLWFGDYVNWK